MSFFVVLACLLAHESYIVLCFVIYFRLGPETRRAQRRAGIGGLSSVGSEDSKLVELPGIIRIIG